MNNTNSTQSGNDAVKDPQKEAASMTISAFTSSLLFNTAVGAGLFAAFCIVRHWNKKIYQPRTYLVRKSIRSPELPPGIFNWITASFKATDSEILEKIGLDAYMFLRFLRMSSYFFWGCTSLAIPILLPINLVGGNESSGSLSNMTIGNIKDPWRLWFPLILTYIFCLTIIVLLWKEMQEYTRRRHAYLMSEQHEKTPQATTILVTAIPKGLSTEDALYNIFNRFPGGVKKIWLNREPKDIAKLCKERDEVVAKLEIAEYNYIRSAYGKPSKKHPGPKEPVRPVGKISSVPFKGEKVDLIDYYTKKLCQLNQQIEQAQQVGSLQSLNSAFIQFHSQFGAHSAVQTVVHPKPLQMTPMHVEISPLDVVWENMSLNAFMRKGRRMIIFALSTAMILLWTIPTFTISSLANISDIIETFPFLEFLNQLPDKAIGFVQGIFPPLLLAGLMALLPFLLMTMATYEGHVRHSNITQSVMTKYFFFLVVNVLLMSTLVGGFFKTIRDISSKGFNFQEIIILISKNLPQASSFFITYVLLKALTGPPLELLQIVPLLLNFFFTHLLAKVPRQIWDVQGRLISVNYGVIFPPQTLIFSIGIVYSTIAPLILPFVAFYFTFHYFVYRHQFLYVYHQPIETGGLTFPIAVRQVFTGIFISEITLFGMMLLKISQFNSVPHMILLAILFGITVLALSNMNEAFKPLVTFLPVALFSKDLHMDKDGVVTDGDEDFRKKIKKTLRWNRLKSFIFGKEACEESEADEAATSPGTREDISLNNLSRHPLTMSPTSITSPMSTASATLTPPSKSIERFHSMPTIAFSKQGYEDPDDQQLMTMPPLEHAATTPAPGEMMPSIHLRPTLSPSERHAHDAKKQSFHHFYHELVDGYAEVGSQTGSPHQLPHDSQNRIQHHQQEYPQQLSPESTFIHRQSSLSPYARPVSYGTQQHLPSQSNTSLHGNHPSSGGHPHLYQQPSHESRSQSFSHSPQFSPRYRGLDRPVSYMSGGSGGHEGEGWAAGAEGQQSTEDVELEQLQDQAYCHPAIYNVQKPVWLPMDERGLAQEEIDRLVRLGIRVATDGARMDTKTAKAAVDGIIYAPGEESRYRLERGE